MFQTNQFFVALIIFSVAGLIANGLYASFCKRKRNGFIASIVLFIIILISSIYLLLGLFNSTEFGLLHIYPFSTLFLALFSASMLLVNLLAYVRSKDYANLLLLQSFSFAGMFIVATAVSVIAILIGLELLAITSAFAMLFEGKHRIEAAVKFFILSSISVAIFTFALAFLLPYNAQLTLTPLALNANLSGTTIILITIALFAVVFGFDTAMFPFNLWVPDVYEGAPSYITSMLAGINKKVAFMALIEVFFIIFIAYKPTISLIFTILAILTMFFGNLLALVQKNVKRLFAYSSISQAGYIMVGIASVTQYGLEASIFYIVAHAFMIIGAFAIIGWLESKNIKTIEDYAGLGSMNSFAAASLTILMLSMAGIPPLIGFAGKFLLFSSAISSGLILLSVVGIINSFISIYYYSKIINSMYSKKEEKRLKMETYVGAVVVIVLAVIVVFGIYPQPLITIATIASKALLGV